MHDPITDMHWWDKGKPVISVNHYRTHKAVNYLNVSLCSRGILFSGRPEGEKSTLFLVCRNLPHSSPSMPAETQSGRQMFELLT